MANNLSKISHDLWLTVRNGKIVDDDNLDIRQIEFWIKNNRAIWIRNDLAKNRTIPQAFIQHVRTNGQNYVSLERVDVSEVSLLPIGCSILRTEIEIPRFLEYNGNSLITRVGPALTTNGSFTRIPIERVPYIGTGRFNSKAIYTFYYNKRIYVISNSTSMDYLGMKKINIQGIFADPTEVPGYLATEDYPITDSLIPYMKDIIVKQDVFTFLSTGRDDENNSTDDGGSNRGA